MAAGDDEERDEAASEGCSVAHKAKKKLPKYHHAKVLDQVGEINAVVASALPDLMASLASASKRPDIAERLKKLQKLFETGTISESELTSARAACLSAM